MNALDPLALAHALGRKVTAVAGKDRQKRLGQFMTPPSMALLTAKLLVGRGATGTVRVAEPSAGSGALACAVCMALAEARQRPSRIELTLFELDEGFRPVLAEVARALEGWLASRGIALSVTATFADYVLDNACVLERGLFGSSPDFDLVIANPPYFKIPKDDPRAIACASVVHGQPNIYGLFMALAAATLRVHGRLAFIVPRSFASGEYFKLFREWFFGEVRPDTVHVFHSRTDAFGEDEVLQENVVFVGTKAPRWTRDGDSADRELTITSSEGLRDLDHLQSYRLPIRDVLDLKSKDKVLCIPSTAEEVSIFHRLKHWTGSLHRHGWQISTGPVVAFRAQGLLVAEPDAAAVPRRRDSLGPRDAARA